MMRRWPILLGLIAATAGGVALVSKRAPPAERPRVALVTSLPLLFGEQFALDVPKVAAVARIEEAFTIVPIATADAANLAGQSVLLMAHPRAQPAEALVDLDAWVRRGGTVVVLADPALQWESSRPLGDRLRPPPDFADTGLLDHWGLVLAVDGRGEGSVRASDRRCAVREQGLVARCRIGLGSARVIADADFVMGKGADADRRVDLMMVELAAGESP